MRTMFNACGVLMVLMLFLAMGRMSHAELSAAGPVDAATTFPSWYQDSTGLTLAPCFDNNGFCSHTMFSSQGFDPGAPVMYPGNFPHEGFYFRAGAAAGDFLYTASLEFGFTSSDMQDGQQVTFARVRIQDTTAPPDTYTITHPYGSEIIQVTGKTGVDFTEDTGYGGPPFSGARLGNMKVGPFLYTSTGLVASNDGNVYIGNSRDSVAVQGTGVTWVSVGGKKKAGIASKFILEGKVIRMSVTPTLIAFPVQRPAPYASEPSTVTVTNVDRVNPLSIDGITLKGANAADFSITDVDCLAGPVQAGGNCTFGVIFSGTASGAASRTAGIVVSGENGSDSRIPLTGIIDAVLPSVVSTAPSSSRTLPNGVISATFSEAMDPATMNEATFTILENGAPRSGTVAYDNAAATVSFQLPDGEEFTAGAVITAQTSTSMTDLAGNPLETPFSWQFVIDSWPAPSIAVTDSVFPDNDHAVSFGDVTTGSASDKIVTITNNGNAGLVIDALTGIGPETTPFSITDDPCSGATIAPAVSCVMTVRFAPSSFGTFTGAFVIMSNDPAAPLVTIDLSGTGFTMPEPNVVVSGPVTTESDGGGTPASANNAPSSPELLYPANGQNNIDRSVACRWKKSQDADGDSVTYRIYYCTDAAFAGCSPETVAHRSTPMVFLATAGLPGLLFFGAIFVHPLRGSRKFLSLMLVLLVVVGVVSACGDLEKIDTPVSQEMSHRLSGIQTGTTYYWKVVADDGKGGLSESAVWSFTTK